MGQPEPHEAGVFVCATIAAISMGGARFGSVNFASALRLALALAIAEKLALADPMADATEFPSATGKSSLIVTLASRERGASAAEILALMLAESGLNPRAFCAESRPEIRPSN